MTTWGVSSNGRHIMSAWDAFREYRNEYWHPDERISAPYTFEEQTAVHLNLIAFRMIVALVIATLVDMGALSPVSKLAAFPPAIEQWIGEIQENDARDPQEASHLGSILSSLFLKRIVRTSFEAVTAGKDLPTATSEEPAGSG